MDLEKQAIERIQTASEMSQSYYGKPLVCTYSGGKDSDVLLELFKRSGIPFEVHNSHTTVDAPQTVYHIRDRFKQLEQLGIKAKIEMPTYKGASTSMWKLIEQKMFPPTRMKRYCCQVLKETGCKNRFIATGVRWDESNARAERDAYETITPKKKDKTTATDEIMLITDSDERRKLIEHCQLKGKMVVNPIIDWKRKDIWEYIKSEKINYNILYEMGYTRVGCVGCPLAGKIRLKEFADFPTYKKAYIAAFQRMIDNLKANGKRNNYSWQCGEDVFRTWMQDENIKGQMDLFED